MRDGKEGSISEAYENRALQDVEVSVALATATSESGLHRLKQALGKAVYKALNALHKTCGTHTCAKGIAQHQSTTRESCLQLLRPLH